MKISINKKLIDDAVEIGNVCPFTLAIKRKFKNRCWVGRKGEVEIYKNRKNPAHYQLSDKAVEFIKNYDRSRPVKGGTFSMKRI